MSDNRQSGCSRSAMVKFKRKLNTKQRDAMIRRKQALAKELAKKPSVSIVCTASGGRDARQNIIILRALRKGRRKHPQYGADIVYKKKYPIRLTEKDVMAIRADVESYRGRLMGSGETSVIGYLNAIGMKMREKIAEKIPTGGSGALRASLSHKVKLGQG